MTEERFIGFYEILYVLHPNVNEAEEKELREKMQRVITGAGGQLVREDYWGRRRLAYEVKKVNEGIYVWVYYRDLSGKSPRAIEEMIRTEARIIRHLILAVPKAKILQDEVQAEREAAAAEAARAAEAERAKAAAARAAEEAAKAAAAAEAAATDAAAQAEATATETAAAEPAEDAALEAEPEKANQPPAEPAQEAPAPAPAEAPAEVTEETERPAGE